MNDDEQTVDQAPWYLPKAPEWVRKTMWMFRNPLQNFRAFVLGVSDCNYTVFGRYPVLTVQRNDLVPPETGFQWCVIKLRVPRLFLSYSGRKVVWQLGWQPNGFFGLKFNIK